jgi:enoyl-[acyl-carrier protein] reductase II
MKQLAHMAMAFEHIQKATEQGDIERGVLPVGQVMGLLNDEPTVAQIMARMVQDAIERQKKLTKIFS